MSEKRKRILPTLVVLVLVISIFTNVFVLGPIVMIGSADPGDITDSYDNSTTLNVTVLHLQPRINWYDFQYNNSGTWETKLNQQIDVNNSAEYRFIVNISSDQGWADIEYINITAWADLGDDSSYNYNNTLGGNINLFLQYENLTGNANYTMVWPDDEVTEGSMTDTNESDPEGSPGNTECHNITLSFTPGYQWRYAPGDGAWDTAAGYNDTWSWNFNITCVDQGGYFSYHNPVIGETIDEFGVYSYTEIISVGWPTMTGDPGTTAVNDSYITIQTRSNGNYSLSVNVTNLTHLVNSNYVIQNTSILTAGGEIASLDYFNGVVPHYYYNNSGAGSLYTSAENNDTLLSTTDIEWGVAIPVAQQAGNYEASIFYHIKTQT